MQSNINYVPAEELASTDTRAQSSEDTQLASAELEIIKIED